jgi:hypothetical protein
MLRSLGQLAARELGFARSEPAASLAPRLPSRYEHADAAAARPSSEDTPHDSTAVDIHTHADAIHAPDRVSDTPSQVRAASTDATQRAGTEAHTRVQRESQHTHDHPASTPRSIESARPAGSDLPSLLPVARESSQPAPASPARRDAIQPLPVAAVHEGVTPRARKREDTLTQHAAERARMESKTPVREASALRPLAPPPLPPRAATPAAAAPPVHITIGRLEIRATKEPAATTTAAPRANATPSLASYLRRRSDGGRS